MTVTANDTPVSNRSFAINAELAGTVLRVSVGVVYLAHGPVLKALVFGLAGVAGYFESLGLPGWTAYLVFAAEAVGGVCLVLGLWARWIALGLIPILVGSIVFDHGSNGWLFSAPGGGWEYPLFLIAASVSVYLSGGGAYALRR